jgi:hypothetical protein
VKLEHYIDSNLSYLKPISFDVIESSDIRRTSDAVKESSLIITATNSSTPLFDGADIKPHTHITGVGSYTPSMQEVDVNTGASIKISYIRAYAYLFNKCILHFCIMKLYIYVYIVHIPTNAYLISHKLT